MYICTQIGLPDKHHIWMMKLKLDINLDRIICLYLFPNKLVSLSAEGPRLRSFSKETKSEAFILERVPLTELVLSPGVASSTDPLLRVCPRRAPTADTAMWRHLLPVIKLYLLGLKVLLVQLVNRPLRLPGQSVKIPLSSSLFT